MTDWLFWPFVLLTGTGTTFLAFRFLLDYRDRERSKILLAQQINPSTLNQIGGLLNMGQPSRASRMFTLMIMTFNKTGRAENLTDDMNSFLADDRQTYETFNRVMSFLSDSAGALGLLGTVWGIFVTFYAGKLDGETILKGMSVSLMTTLVGLIISLLLNLGSTTAFAWYNSQMKLLSARAEDLRQALLGFQRGHVPNRKNGSSAKRAQTPADEFAGSTSQYREQYSGHEY